MRHPVGVAIVGATASGKSDLAHRIALQSGGEVEIVCVDAMSVYRGMDLATAKPSVNQRREVRYHLVDEVEPDEEFSVRDFQTRARHALDEIARLGHRALLVGGTGLYARALVDELEIPGRFPDVREDLDRRARTNLAKLYDELSALDPLAASRMDSQNERRIVRALEVTLGTGRPFSSFGSGLGHYGASPIAQIGLRVSPDALNERIAERFRAWMAQGLLDEVERLAGAPRPMSRTARQAVGYRQLLEHVEEGRDLQECVTDAITASRRLARRQRSWFERDPRIEWFDSSRAAEERIGELLERSPELVGDCER